MSRDVSLIWSGGAEAYAVFPADSVPPETDLGPKGASRHSILKVVVEIKHGPEEEASPPERTGDPASRIVLDVLKLEAGREKNRFIKFPRGAQRVVFLKKIDEQAHEEILNYRLTHQEADLNDADAASSSWRLLIVSASRSGKPFDVETIRFNRQPAKDDLEELVREDEAAGVKVIAILAQKEVEERSRSSGAAEIRLGAAKVVYPTASADFIVDAARRTASTNESRLSEVRSIQDYLDVESPFVHDLTLKAAGDIREEEAFFVHILRQRADASEILMDSARAAPEKVSAVRKAAAFREEGPLLPVDEHPCVIVSLNNEIVSLDDGSSTPADNGAVEVKYKNRTAKASFYAASYDDVIGVAIPAGIHKTLADSPDADADRDAGAWRLYRIQKDGLEPCDLKDALSPRLRELVQKRIDAVVSATDFPENSILSRLKVAWKEVLKKTRNNIPARFKKIAPPDDSGHKIGSLDHAFDLLAKGAFVEAVGEMESAFDDLIETIGSSQTADGTPMSELLTNYRTSRSALLSFSNFSVDPALYELLFCSKAILSRVVRVGTSGDRFNEPLLDLTNRASRFLILSSRNAAQSSGEDAR